MRYYLGVDIGTYATKAVLVDRDFRVTASVSVAHGMDNPAPRHFEQDAEQVWWGDFCRAVRQLLGDTGVRAGDIAAVGADTLGCDCLPVDEHCRPLRKAILYGIDARADKEIAFLNQHYGTGGGPGRPLGTDDIAPKILWVKNHEPDIYARTGKFLTGSSFITARLTGRYVIDRFLACSSFLPLYREDGSINAGECELYCRPDQLCECLSVHEIAGGVTAEAAAATGLAEGTPVICGTGDSTSEAISVGVVKPGSMMMQFGSTLFFYCCSDRPIADPRLYSGVFTVPETFCVAGGTNTGGTLIRWVRDTLYPGLAAEKGDEGAYQEMARLGAAIPPGSEGLVVLPYFAGERCPVNDPLARGLYFGLTLRHGREHLYHAALEGVGYSMAQNIRIIEEAGLPLRHLTAVGGGTKNALWMQMVADIIGKPFSLPEVSIGGSYGCALMGALGVGDLAGFDDLAAAVRPGRVIRPDMARHEQYRPYLEIYGALYGATADLMHRLP
jgi:xylulokinase